MPTPETPDPLDRLLEQWKDAAPPPPGSVAPEVWRRLAQRVPALPAPTWLERLHAAFARPSFAVAFVAACMLLGLFLAEARSSRLHVQAGAQLAQEYLRLIDPLLSASETTQTSTAEQPR